MWTSLPPITLWKIRKTGRLRCPHGALLHHVRHQKVDYATTLEMIRAMGPEHVVVSTDLGQPTGLYPDEGMEAFATALYQDGFTAEQVRQMTVYNQRKLLGKD